MADLNPKIGTDPGKTRPVLVIQSDLLNRVQHPSMIICPLTIRAIDNNRLIRKIGEIPDPLNQKISENLQILLDLI